MRRRAFCLIRRDPVYRREAFVRGLETAGFQVQNKDWSMYPGPIQATTDDVLVIWNRYAGVHETALQFERGGGMVLVAENAYLGLDRSNRRRYALAVGGHNGSGYWFIGGPERWRNLGISLAPWREQGEHILVCPNRSFGMPGFIMPPMWPETVVKRLRSFTQRPIRLRPHPGNGPPKIPLVEDLRGAWAVVIWSSSAGCEALVNGIPVFSEAPWWILSGAACPDITQINEPPLLDRLPAMEKLAWAQWDVEEIESGLPFLHLLDRTSA